MRLLLLRHGQTHSNVDGALDTARPGADLTELGRRQAWAAAQALSDAEITAVACSTLVRTQQTAAPLVEAAGLTPSIQDGLREVAAGDYEMATDEEAIDGYLHTVGSWLDGSLDLRMPGGETGADFLARYDAAIAAACADKPDALLVVSHGAAIRVWVSHRATGEHAPIFEALHNTGCITLVGDLESGWHIDSWQREPIGGAWLDDKSAPDPTGGELDD